VVGIYKGMRAEGATNSPKKQWTSHTIEAYAWYYLLTSPKGASFVQILTSG
jgi:hypothetical protein